MTYITRATGFGESEGSVYSAAASTRRQPILLLVADDDSILEVLQPICDFLDIAVERIPSEHDLTDALTECRPMGVVTELDCRGQDGYNVMITVAKHDCNLPILLITGDEPALVGAVDAIEELFHLGSLARSATLPGVGDLVNFIFTAGRRGRCIRMMPV